VEEPKRGGRRKLLDLARVNAEERLRQVRDVWVSDEQRTTGALEELQKTLDLSKPPARIECYDISHQSGTTTVGSMTVFLDGKPTPAHYRRFRIKHVAGVDDFASMEEVLKRRFKRLASEESADASFAAVPDLVVIDGGKGQVSAAATALAETGADTIPLVGLAKRFEDVYRYDPHTKKSDLANIAKDSAASYLLQRIRDEAHRFAITYGRNLRRKNAPRSALDDLPGIGPVKKKQLLRTFGSVKRIKQASLPELEELVGKAAGKVVKENL
jgi:excinuclease ABC subunit C